MTEETGKGGGSGNQTRKEGRGQKVMTNEDCGDQAGEEGGLICEETDWRIEREEKVGASLGGGDRISI